MANNTMHEKVGLVALLVSPTNLNKAWTETADIAEVPNLRPYLENLGFAGESLANAITLLQDLHPVRGFFDGVAELLKANAYAGEEPHPPEPEANAILTKLRQGR